MHDGCMCMYRYTHAHIHSDIHTCIHTNIHTHIRTHQRWTRSRLGPLAMTGQAPKLHLYIYIHIYVYLYIDTACLDIRRLKMSHRLARLIDPAEPRTRGIASAMPAASRLRDSKQSLPPTPLVNQRPSETCPSAPLPDGQGHPAVWPT